MKARRSDQWTLDKLTWASKWAEKLPTMPPPAVRLALRQALDIPRHTIVAAIQCSYTPFIAQELGRTPRSKVAKSEAYERVVGYMAALVKEQDSELYRSIMEGTASDA